MKVAENFDLREFVPPDIHKKWGDKSIWFVNPWCYEFAQFLKDWLSGQYDEEVLVIVNSWHYGGNRKWSCLRTYQYIKDQIRKGVKTATLSQHIGGQAHAFDCLIQFKASKKYINPSEVRAKMIEQSALMLSHGLTTLEGDRWAKTWIHCDNRPHGENEIMIVGA